MTTNNTQITKVMSVSAELAVSSTDWDRALDFMKLWMVLQFNCRNNFHF